MPTFGAMDYARKTVASLYANTPKEEVNLFVLTVDDGTPDWDGKLYDAVGGPVSSAHWEINKGLTYALNTGFSIISATITDPHTYVAAVNSDILFTPGWWRGLVHALDHGFDFVGPLSNAPGVSSGGAQDLAKWCSPALHAVVRDDPEQHALIAAALRKRFSEQVAVCNINGFFMMGKHLAWRLYSEQYPDLTFPATIDVMPSGRKNPWPTMTGQEDWLIHKVKQQGGRAGVALDSFIFHYRSMSRGEKFATKGAYRPQEGQ